MRPSTNAIAACTDLGWGAATVALCSLLTLATGCFTELTDRDCDTAADCFGGEVCSSAGQCVGVVELGGDTGGDPQTLTATITVSAGNAPAFVRVESTQTCSCQAPCQAADLEPGRTYAICAEARGHRPCRVAEAFTRDSELTIALAPCDGCDELLPDGCTCPATLDPCQ